MGSFVLSKSSKKQPNPAFQNNSKVLLTQIALSIHSIFECMSLGVQTDTHTILTLLTGIAIHKWAEGLTLGFAYKAVNMPESQAKDYSMLHSFLNGMSVFVGWSLASQNKLVAGVLSSISAGTFLYVCMVEKLQHEFKGR